MKSTQKKLKAGDILELRHEGFFGYLQYVGKHREYGPVVKVKPRLFDRRPAADPQLFSDGYIAFYPAELAVRTGRVEVVGHLPAPAVPATLRRAGARVGRVVRTWVIEHEGGETVKETLTSEDLLLPIASLWNHEFLVERMRDAWQPSDAVSSA